MKETRTTESRITLEDEGVRAEIVLTDAAKDTMATIEARSVNTDMIEIEILTAAEAAAIERIAGRVRELLARHEGRLAVKPAPAALSVVEQRPADPPRT